MSNEDDRALLDRTNQLIARILADQEQVKTFIQPKLTDRIRAEYGLDEEFGQRLLNDAAAKERQRDRAAGWERSYRWAMTEREWALTKLHRLERRNRSLRWALAFCAAYASLTTLAAVWGWLR